MARQANENATYLANQLRELPRFVFDYPQETNMMFVNFSRKSHKCAIEAEATYHFYGKSLDINRPDDEALHAGLVCDWSIEKSDIDRFFRLISPN